MEAKILQFPNKPPRLISDIAKDIKAEWKNVYYGAVPYLEAMSQLGTIDDTYLNDPASYVVNYFLCNAARFRGGRAAELKAELKALVRRG